MNTVGNMKLLVVIVSCFIFNITAQVTTDIPATTTPNPFLEPCQGQWTSWSTCFPGTISDTTQWRERHYEMTPSQKDAPTCNTVAPLFYVETESCNSATNPPVEDISTIDCTKLGLYQCGTGRCVETDLLCNGDDDCGDNSDEYPTNRSGCSKPDPITICGFEQSSPTNNNPPKGERYLTGIPGIAEFAAGFDILTGKFKDNALSMAGHGSCRSVLISGSTDSYYRIPENVASFRQIDEIIVDPTVVHENTASLLNATSDGLKYNLNFGGTLPGLSGTVGMTQNDVIKSSVLRSVSNDQLHTESITTAHINTAKISLKEAKSLEVSNTFISRLMDLPYLEFSFSKYMNFIEDFGTHYITSAKLGATYTDVEVYSRCWLGNDGGYELYSKEPWRTVVPECSRQSFFLRLDPSANALSPECEFTENGDTKTIREEAVDVKISVAGGSVSTSSDLKFDFGKTTWDAWVQSVTNSPTLNLKNFQLEKISSLVSSHVVMMDSDRKTEVMNHIDRAIDIYLGAYDAPTFCKPCNEESFSALADDFYYYDDEAASSDGDLGVRYLTGTGQDYRCYCTYETPLKEQTCGAEINFSSVITLAFGCFLAYWNAFGN